MPPALDPAAKTTREELMASTFWYICQRIIEECLSKFLEQIKEKQNSSVEESQHSYPNAGEDPSSEPREKAFDSRNELNCVCYGVGKFSSCVISRYQLALLLLLLEKLQIPKHRCHVFDPLFSRWEIAVLQALGLTVIFENEEGKRKILTPTIVYMIHCGKALYNNLLWKNWSVDALSKTIIIGNSFKRIEERLLARILTRDYAYIAKILKGIEETAFPEDPQYMDIFNDTSVHWFPVPKLMDIPSKTWLPGVEPTYLECEELEIIRNQGQESKILCP